MIAKCNVAPRRRSAANRNIKGPGPFRSRGAQRKATIRAQWHVRAPHDFPAIAFRIREIARIGAAVAVADRTGDGRACGDRLGEVVIDIGLGRHEDRIQRLGL